MLVKHITIRNAVFLITLLMVVLLLERNSYQYKLIDKLQVKNAETFDRLQTGMAEVEYLEFGYERNYSIKRNITTKWKGSNLINVESKSVGFDHANRDENFDFSAKPQHEYTEYTVANKTKMAQIYSSGTVGNIFENEKIQQEYHNHVFAYDYYGSFTDNYFRTRNDFKQYQGCMIKEDDGVYTIKIVNDKFDISIELDVDTQKGYLITKKIEDIGRYGIRYELIVKPKKFHDQYWYPAFIHRLEYKDGIKNREQRYTVTNLIPNVEMPDSTFTVQAILNSRIVKMHDHRFGSLRTYDVKTFDFTTLANEGLMDLAQMRISKAEKWIAQNF